ncbi:MAG: hypothetical protein IH623_03505 [Verrucomicrobia bacterium]|nr:hypothetical protein [Verrucomicrobiota bacterium]
MPGALGYGWHESNRGEYLAQYFLAALGVSAPVIRQEDIGVDFFCSLAKEENKKLTFHSPFMVQHGAEGSKRFAYGGYDKKDSKKWRGDELEWLFSQELPLFLCVTNRVEGHFHLYSTSAMWLLRYQFGDMTSVVLCPDEEHDPLKESVRDKVGKEKEHGDGYEYHVPLGNPIVSLSFSDVNQEGRASAIASLTLAINLEQTNITLRRLGVHVASWFPDIQPNDPASLQKSAGAVFWNGIDGRNVPKQIESLKDIVITLALNLNAQGKIDDLALLAPVFKFYRMDEMPDWILSKLPKLILDNLKT